MLDHSLTTGYLIKFPAVLFLHKLAKVSGMDEMMKEILGYLRHDKLEVRKQAVATIFEYSNNPEVLEFIKNSDMMKALKACLYDLVRVHFFELVFTSFPPKEITNRTRTWCIRLCW